MNVTLELLRLLNDEDGLTTVEYAVAGALVAAAVVVSFTRLGNNVGETITGLCGVLDGAQASMANTTTGNC
ncbi:pilus assembly protein [Oceanisphaera psychrotolerans]|uniref:pilus assembly protein n=1 Tax=Oceanisphaera psychrotolerans TaxID=1414654 RepID=UPI0009F37912|nr:pilus assembly protein [Oceanisphaera psychrotolerans]